MYSNVIVFMTILLITPCILRAEESTKLDDIFTPLLRTVKFISTHATRPFTQSREYRRLLEKRNKAAQEVPSSTPFPCNSHVKVRSDLVPTNSHQVRPGDIDIVGNLGDSLSAGTGISAVSVIQEGYAEERGRSFAGGGEKTWRNYLTLPNILKVFNHKLFGFALRGGLTIEKSSQFNVAENGAVSENVPFMVKELVKRIKNDPRVDVKNHWKMITIMIGDNDFCGDVCYLPNYYDSLENHKKHLLYVLRYLRDNLPRTIVNVVPPPRLDIFYEMNNVPIECYVLHNILCPCIRGLAFANKRKIISDIMVKWQQIDLEVSDMDEFDLDDFTVIPHRFTTNYTFPRTNSGKIDYRFLAPDCFHFSEKAQARFANNLWNSLLEPFGKKSTDGAEVFSKFNCPTEDHPYIFTRRNSRK